MEPNRMVNETLMDSAACEALGANMPEESAAYQRQVAADATGAARRLERELSETTARLAGASPHMKPPADLRGRILQATAPKTFKIDDYRKATREDYRFYKWGFYAAAVILVAASLYNMDTRGKLDQANKNIAVLQDREKQIIAKSSEIMTTFARGGQITWYDDESKKPLGKAIVDLATHKAVLIFPQETVPSGTHPQLNLRVNNEQIAFDTTLISATAKDLGFVVPKNAPDIAKIMNVTTLQPDTTIKPQIAGTH